MCMFFICMDRYSKFYIHVEMYIYKLINMSHPPPHPDPVCRQRAQHMALPTDNTKPQQIMQSPEKTIQRFRNTIQRLKIRRNPKY